MNALVCVLATSITAAGVDYGWQPTNGGDLEYVIQIEPALFEALKSGQEITSEIPPELAGVRRFRIRVGSGPVPRILPNNPQFGARGAQIQSIEGGAPAPAVQDSGQPGSGEWPRGPMRPRTADDAAQPPPTDQSAWADRAQSALDRLNRAKAGAQLYDPQAGGAPPWTGTVSDSPRLDDRVRIPAEGSPANGQTPSSPAKATLGDPGGGYQPPLDPRHLERYKGSSNNSPVSPAIDYPGFDRQTIPSRPGTTGADLSGRYQTPPAQPDLRSEFQTTGNTGFGQNQLGGSGSSTASTAPRSTLPGFGLGTSPRDPLSREPDGLFATRPVQEASYTETTTGAPTASIQMGKPSLPESAALQPYKPWGWFVAVLFGFLISLSANFYLGWIAYDLHRRYRSAVMQMTDAAALGV